MQNRQFKKFGKEVSILGMGVMRLIRDAEGNVDEDAAVRLIRYAIDSGINYIDTAYTYHEGNSEKIVGKALKEGYREKITLATKMPPWLCKDEEHMKEMFDEQMKRLDTDCVDMYLVHSLTNDNWQRTKDLNILPFLGEMKAQGKIKHIGFSFHGSFELFKEVIDAFPWEFCQIQLNYMDKNLQAGVKGLKYAAEKGLGVIIMEPLKGGRLAEFVPPTVQQIFNEGQVKRPFAEWAFKWLANMPEVTLVLSGMNSAAQIEENVRIMSAKDLDLLSQEEKDMIDRASDEYNRLIKYSCTGCEYCMPCPQGLDIPAIIRYYNDWHVYGNNPSTKFEYVNWIDKGCHASDCVGCGTCEAKCPQGLSIIQAMKDVAGELGV